ncbi:MAG: [FeFe] hydrogenase, group A [Coriobacteriaceae bacterium]|jgi:NADH-quinone oxidoreductase subunit G|nr:[FeFe] hydrogenase, group A [Coriobacteriaceae bacterium]
MVAKSNPKETKAKAAKEPNPKEANTVEDTANSRRVNVTVNGRQVQAFENMTILAAASMAGVKIPTLCFYWGLNDPGACRVCAVEVEGEDQLVAACNNKVYEGMAVKTNTAKVRKARKLNVELLLSQHNVQCTSCVRGGSCELRLIANDLNISEVRFRKGKKKPVWNRDFPLIRDASKCIACWRCVQVCDNMQASHIWAMKNRATHTGVGVAKAQPIEQSLCTICGQCITHCPTAALKERDDVDRVLDAIADPDKITLIQIAPSVRTSWGESLGLDREKATVNRLVAALRAVGIDYVFDTDFTADLTITEEASEFVERFTHKDSYSWPMFTSCCPAWVRWVKGNHPEMVDRLSTAKSPQQMFGATAKSYYAQALGVDPCRIVSLSAMPCLAKKHECALPTMNDACGAQDVDVALTVREIDRLICADFIDLENLAEEDFDEPLGIGSGAGEIFGATGGVMEAALRSGYYYVVGTNPDPDAFAVVRGQESWKEATFDLAGTPVRIAIASGLGNAEKLIEAIKAGEADYDFVEIMACPGGCVGGGGQPISKDLGIRAKRSKVLYDLDSNNAYRFSHENPAIVKIYDEFFGKPLSEKSHHLLHTDHQGWGMPNA